MKRSLAVIGVCISSLCSFGQGTHLSIKQSDVVKNDLLGSVKKYTSETRKNASVGKSEEEVPLFDIRTYDKKGNFLLRITKNSEGHVQERVERLYKDGFFIKELKEDFERGTSAIWTVEMAQRENKVVKRNTANRYVITITYTDKGYERRVEETDRDGQVISSSEFMRLPNGKARKLIFYDSQNKPTDTIEFTWNADGTKAQALITKHTNPMVFREAYEYPQKDDEGNWTKRIKKTYLVRGEKEFEWSEETTTRTIEYY